MLRANRVLKYWHKLFGISEEQNIKYIKRERNRDKRGKIIVLILSALVLTVSSLVTGYVFASANSENDLLGSTLDSGSSLSASHGLEPRLPAQKPKIIEVPEKGVYKHIVIVKFVEGSMVRLRGNTFVSLNPALPSNLDASLSSLNDLLLRPEVKQVKRLFTRPEAELDEEKERGERLSRKQLADLNLYYVIYLVSGANPEPILSALNSLDIVEIAYLEPIPEPAVITSNQTQTTVPLSTAQAELITNGGFESGSTGWILSGNFYADSRFSYPRSGSGYAYLSNSDGTAGNNLIGSMYQTVTIPSSATSVTLTFWYNITSQETETTPYDVLNVTIQNSTGGYLATVAVYSNVNKQTLGVYSQKSFDMTPYKGQTIRLHFLGTTDSSLPTTFRIDDVSIVAISITMPTVTTLSVSAVTSTSATLNGSVNPNGSATTAWFEWGTSSTLSSYNQTPSQLIGSGTTSQAVSAPLSGLIPNTTYYFRAAASNAAGTQRGSILSFTTLSITPTPNFQSQQGYLSNTSTGVHALYGWTLPGGTGIGVKIVDIEGGWQTTHEDFPSPFTPVDGTNSTDSEWRQHGTAVVGEMVARNNGIGVTGIAYDAQYSGVSHFTYSVADAINRASSKVSPGDIILIELHALGPDSSLTCECNCEQFELIPMEYWIANYDAIRTATANGRIVVEAGGNGSMNLDSSIYGGAFDRNQRDSRAILVGAGVSTNRNPHCWTNYGSRMDVQGWGDSVVTTGYGDLFNGTQDGGSNDPNRYYTATFGGTSSASPIVAGSVAAIQGRYKVTSVGGVLSPLAMRTLIRNTGTAQGTGGSWGFKQIGPLPNIEAAINSIQNQTLTVNSTNPNSGVSITVTPNDNNGQGSGTTQFARVYNNGTSVTLTAPSTANGNNFQKWQRNGVDYSISLTAQVTMDADYTMTAVYGTTGDIIFQDDMESGPGSWYAQAPWALTTEASHSPTHSWTDSPGGNYSNNLNVSLWSPVLNFLGLSTVTLTFWHRYDLENDYDFGRVWIWDGANFTLVASYTGINTDWTQEALDLSGFAGLPSVQIVFQLLSNSSVTSDGWYIDDVVVTKTPIPSELPILSIDADTSGANLLVAVAITDAGDYAGQTGTFGIWATHPTLGCYTFYGVNDWRPCPGGQPNRFSYTINVAGPFTVLNYPIALLPAGNYTFNFNVDVDNNGTWDAGDSDTWTKP